MQNIVVSIVEERQEVKDIKLKKRRWRNIYMIETIDLNYVKKEQDKFLEHLKSIEGIRYQESKFGVPVWLTLAILSELVEVLNTQMVGFKS
jgi:hypothetical protein